MATYVMSDIHGCYTEFQEMLKKIGFDGEKDELIIAGDIVDRGNENYEMLEYAVSEPSGVTFLMGNHDRDFINYVNRIDRLYASGFIPEDVDLPTLVSDPAYSRIYDACIIDQYDTLYKLITDSQKPADREDLRRWAGHLSKFSYYVRREMNGRSYIIVHAGYISEKEFERYRRSGGELRDDIREFYVWAREEGLKHGEGGSTVIFGHTPTIALHTFYNHGKVWIKKKGKKRFINIDCGCVFLPLDPDSNLACIRLDDEKVFYLR
ncbi:MAG: metallophosphoesterase [Eubacterium sp.]|nr:metallophosphoesterase [Eubacterium sp.]